MLLDAAMEKGTTRALPTKEPRRDILIVSVRGFQMLEI